MQLLLSVGNITWPLVSWCSSLFFFSPLSISLLLRSSTGTNRIEDSLSPLYRENLFPSFVARIHISFRVLYKIESYFYLDFPPRNKSLFLTIKSLIYIAFKGLISLRIPTNYIMSDLKDLIIDFNQSLKSRDDWEK